MEPDPFEKAYLWFKKWRRVIVWGIYLAMAIQCAGCYPMNDWEIGTGYRDSTIRRVKNSGLVYKTWEVEGVDYGVRTGESFQPEKFQYSVIDPQIIEQIQAIPPETKVRIYYSERRTAWYPRGDSRYFITKIEVAK